MTSDEDILGSLWHFVKEVGFFLLKDLQYSARTAASRQRGGGAIPARIGSLKTGVAYKHPETMQRAL